ncbi:MAG: hypothetical protein KAX20_03515 [Candidatus Omnitrophica bacterium]|nr:hypothetical protein [Candidatus Omnitrophota bacterium]
MYQLIARFRENLSVFSPSALKRWFAIVLASCAFFALWIGGHSSPIFRIAGYIGYIGWLLFTGIPFVVGASLLFGSQEAHHNIADSTQKGSKVNFASLFTTYIVLTLLVMAVAVVIGFALGLLLPAPVQILGALPYMLALTLAISLLLCPIAAFLALTADQWKTSTVLGIAMFLAVGLATGAPRLPVNYPEIALFGPTHLLTALLFILIAGAEYQGAIEIYVGISFVPSQLILPIILLIFASAISFVFAKRMFESNLRRWTIERYQWLTTEEGTQDKPEAQSRVNLSALHEELKQRRRIMAALAVAAILLIPLAGMGYTSVRQEEWTQVVYESPAGGEMVEIGQQWLSGEFFGVDAPDNVDILVGCQGTILSGGGNLDSITVNFDHRPMTLDEFLHLNDTEIEDMFGRGESGTHGTTGTFGCGWGSIHAVQYTWALRFLDVLGQTEGTISVSFRVIIRAR